MLGKGCNSSRLTFSLESCSLGIVKVMHLEDFRNKFLMILDQFWVVKSCMFQEASRRPEDRFKLAYLSQSGPNRDQVGSNLAKDGAMLGLSWVQLGSIWIHVGSSCGPPAFPEQTLAPPHLLVLPLGVSHQPFGLRARSTVYLL